MWCVKLGTVQSALTEWLTNVKFVRKVTFCLMILVSAFSSQVVPSIIAPIALWSTFLSLVTLQMTGFTTSSSNALSATSSSKSTRP